MNYSYKKENGRLKVYLMDNGHKISDFEFNKEECKELYVNLCEVLFEHDTISTELKTFNQIDEEKHWQSIREQAAIAAMQGLITNVNVIGAYGRYAELAIKYADELVEQLKKKEQ